MGLYSNRLQVPIKELSADWIPEEGELFQDSSDNLYMGDNVTASNALTPINGGGTSTFTPEGLYLSFSDVVTSGDPGAGAFKFNNATAGSITKLYVSTIDQDGTSTVEWLNLCTSGVLKVNKASGGMVQFSVSRMVNQTTHFEFDVDHVFGTLPTAGNCYVDFVPDAPGVREWVAMLSQDGGATDPTITVLKNSLGTDISYERFNTGIYQPVLSVPSYFTSITPALEVASGTLACNGNFGVATIAPAGLTISTQDIDVTAGTADLADGMLANTLVRISHT